MIERTPEKSRSTLQKYRAPGTLRGNVFPKLPTRWTLLRIAQFIHQPSSAFLTRSSKDHRRSSGLSLRCRGRYRVPSTDSTTGNPRRDHQDKEPRQGFCARIYDPLVHLDPVATCARCRLAVPCARVNAGCASREAPCYLMFILTANRGSRSHGYTRDRGEYH